MHEIADKLVANSKPLCPGPMLLHLALVLSQYISYHMIIRTLVSLCINSDLSVRAMLPIYPDKRTQFFIPFRLLM